MKNILIRSILFLAVLFFSACQKEETPVPPSPPTIEGFSVTINKDILNDPDYMGYLISDHTGKVYHYELTKGQVFQEDIIYLAEKSSDIEMAVTFIWIDEFNPVIEEVRNTSFIHLPNGAYIESIEEYYFSWENAIKTFQISGVETIDDVQFSELNSSIEITDINLSGNLLNLSIRLPNTFENFIVLKANGEEDYRYVEMGIGQTDGQYEYSELLLVEKKEIRMPDNEDWSSYIFGNNLETGGKMALYGSLVEGESTDHFYTVYYPRSVEFSSLDMYFRDYQYYYGDNNVEIFQSLDSFPSAVDLRDQLEFVEKIITPEAFTVKSTTSTDIVFMRYETRRVGNDLRWDVVAHANQSILEFVLPKIPDEIRLEYPSDLIFNDRLTEVHTYLINIQSPLPNDFWKKPSVSLNFDWLIEKGAYSVRNHEYL